MEYEKTIWIQLVDNKRGLQKKSLAATEEKVRAAFSGFWKLLNQDFGCCTGNHYLFDESQNGGFTVCAFVEMQRIYHQNQDDSSWIPKQFGAMDFWPTSSGWKKSIIGEWELQCGLFFKYPLPIDSSWKVIDQDRSDKWWSC